LRVCQSTRRWNMRAGRGLSRLPAVCFVALVLAVVSVTADIADDPAPTPADRTAEIRKLIGDLAGKKYSARQSAHERLLNIGAVAIPALRQAREDSASEEVRQRIDAIIEEVNKRENLARSAAMKKNLAWEFVVPGGASGPPVVRGGLALVAGGDGVLRALDARTGKVRWQRPGATGDFRVAGQRVYVLDRDSTLRALDLATGKQREGFRSPPVTTAPAAGTEGLYVGAGNALLALDALTGKRKWAAKLPGVAVYAPVAAGDSVFVVTRDASLSALDAAAGKLRWRHTIPARTNRIIDVPYHVTCVGEWVCFRTEDGVTALSQATGKEVWRCSVDDGAGGFGWIFRRPSRGPNHVTPGGGAAMAVVDGKVLVPAHGEVRLIAAKDGAKVRSITDGGGSSIESTEVRRGVQVVVIRASVRYSPDRMPAVADGVVYVTTIEGLHAVDLEAGREIWKLQIRGLCAARPEVADGMIFLATGKDAGAGNLGRRRRAPGDRRDKILAYRLPPPAGLSGNAPPRAPLPWPRGGENPRDQTAEIRRLLARLGADESDRQEPWPEEIRGGGVLLQWPRGVAWWVAEACRRQVRARDAVVLAVQQVRRDRKISVESAAKLVEALSCQKKAGAHIAGAIERAEAVWRAMALKYSVPYYMPRDLHEFVAALKGPVTDVSKSAVKELAEVWTTDNPAGLVQSLDRISAAQRRSINEMKAFLCFLKHGYSPAGIRKRLQQVLQQAEQLRDDIDKYRLKREAEEFEE